MRRLKIIISFVLCIVASQSHSQVFNNLDWYNNDSLKAVLTEQKGIERVNTLNRLASSLSYEDFDQSMEYANEGLALAEKLGYAEGIAHAERNFGHIHYYDGNYPLALNFYWDALYKFEELKNYRMVALAYKDLAVTHLYGNNFDKAMELAEESVLAFKRKNEAGQTIGSVADTMRIRSGQGLALRLTGRSDQALKIYLKYLEIGEEYRFEITDMLVHHGLVASCYQEIGKFDSALVYLHKALAFPTDNKSLQAMRHEHMRRMGSIFHTANQLDSAIHYLSLACEWFSFQGFLMQSNMAARELGDIYVELNDHKLAEKQYRLAETIIEEMFLKQSIYRYDSLKYIVSWGAELYLPFSKNRIKEYIYDRAILTYERMYRYYQERGSIDQAFLYLQKYSSAKDILVGLTRRKDLIDIQTRYETEAKEKQIEFLTRENLLKQMKLNQNKWFIIGLACLLLLGALLTLLLIRQNKLRNDQNTLLLQQKLLRAQMNPHFLFNSLTSIQNFIISEKPGLASDYLSRFSKLVRQILDSSLLDYVPLEQELDTIKNYLSLQKVRYNELFEYQIDVDESIDTEAVYIPPMLAQPFIENSIEHGFKNRGSKGHLCVRFLMHHSVLKLIIEDNGIGRVKSLEIQNHSNKNHHSLSTGITRERLSAINRKSRKKISLKIEDLVDSSGIPSGTRVTIEIPV